MASTKTSPALLLNRPLVNDTEITAALNVDWEPYFKVASQEWLYKMEFGWWQNYCDTVIGA